LSRVKTVLLSRGLKFDIMVLVGLLVVLAATMLMVPRAEAQIEFPRLGISASPTAYVDTMTVDAGQEFVLYVCALGHNPGEPLDQDVSVLQWAVHQVCCGAVLEILDVQYNPNFYHEGTPYFGVSSSSESCVTEDFITLATLTMTINAPEPGEYLAAAGPFAAAVDCEGNNPLFMDMPLTLNVVGEVTPVSGSTWGSIKASYR
jgi:hypothetical protein